MEKIAVVGVDLAKNVFQIHAVGDDGSLAVRRSLRRAQFLAFFSRLEPCLIGMEACGGAHCWARELARLGPQVRLMPPSYVKPYVKRGKTDAADAEAICEAVTRPSMRFVPIKSEEQQSILVAHRTRDFLVRQLTQTTNALRAHMAEFGIVTAKGAHNVGRLLQLIDEAALPNTARDAIRLLVTQFAELQTKVDAISMEIRKLAMADETARRLQTIPGVGPITASVLTATLPDASGFKSSRDLSAWIGLTPKPHSSGGREKLGGISKMGNRYIRKLLYLGAMGVMIARRRQVAGDDWLWKIMERKPMKLAAIAVANRMARTVWALLRTGQSYRPAVA